MMMVSLFSLNLTLHLMVHSLIPPPPPPPFKSRFSSLLANCGCSEPNTSCSAIADFVWSSFSTNRNGPETDSPWCDRHGWLGVKNQFPSFRSLNNKTVAERSGKGHAGPDESMLNRVHASLACKVRGIWKGQLSLGLSWAQQWEPDVHSDISSVIPATRRCYS